MHRFKLATITSLSLICAAAFGQQIDIIDRPKGQVAVLAPRVVAVGQVLMLAPFVDLKHLTLLMSDTPEDPGLAVCDLGNHSGRHELWPKLSGLRVACIDIPGRVTEVTMLPRASCRRQWSP